ncbi:flagellar basal body-associated protein FliL [Salinisphaera sp. T31B1]|uniref:flagellar basal body-associated protein FliL n=1 Tax=Salinisphaera sp. T31B1 TaxID=727963 RepID=UPI0033411503
MRSVQVIVLAMVSNPLPPSERQSGRISFVLLLTIVLGVLAVGAGAVAATYFMMRDDGQPADNQARTTRVPPPEPVFVAIEPLTVNLAGDSGRVLYVRMSVQVADASAATQLGNYMPRVRNRILMTLSDQHAEDLVSSQGKQTLATKLGERIAEPLTVEGDPVAVDNVLFTDFIVQ